MPVVLAFCAAANCSLFRARSGRCPGTKAPGGKFWVGAEGLKERFGRDDDIERDIKFLYISIDKKFFKKAKHSNLWVVTFCKRFLEYKNNIIVYYKNEFESKFQRNFFCF